MIEIIKQGELRKDPPLRPVLEFHCTRCGCIFRTDEYISYQTGERRMACPTPDSAREYLVANMNMSVELLERLGYNAAECGYVRIQDPKKIMDEKLENDCSGLSGGDTNA